MLQSRRNFVAGLISGGLFLHSPALAEELFVEKGIQWKPEDEKIAENDRNKFAVELRSSYAYFTTSTVAEEQQGKLATALCGIVPSLSNKTDLQYQIPKQISDTVWRVDLQGLGWYNVWTSVIQTYYPYYNIAVDRTKYVPQIIRADWFCADMFDEVETKEAQYLLLYSGAVPKNRDEFLKFWRVQNESEFTFGMIEGKSGVAVNDKEKKNSIRQMENRTTARRGYCWITKDSARIAGVTDPVANMHLGPNGTEFDASEYIVGVYKVLNGVSGCLQAYFLTDGNRTKFDKDGKKLDKPQTGTRQAKAPVDIVEDTTDTRGKEIRNGSSCVYCHTKGIIPPTQNEFRRFILRDTRLNLPYKDKYEVERYQGSDLEQEVTLNQALYESAIKACTGVTAAEFSAAYQSTVKNYVSGINLPQLARELAIYYPRGYLTGDELQLALAYSSDKGLLGARTAAIGEDDTINRDTVILDYYKYQEAIKLWRQRRK